LIRLASEIASHPAGTVTRACSTSASKEAAFRLLENAAVRSEAVRDAAIRAAARRCQGHATVVVPVDATTLTITDAKRTKGLGSVGARDKGARGVHVMTALAVAKNGSALGICAQQTWIRTQRSKHGECRRTSPTRKSETLH
jgi:hypothetical protein